MEEVKKSYTRQIIALVVLCVIGLGIYAVVRAPVGTVETLSAPSSTVPLLRADLSDDVKKANEKYIRAKIANLSNVVAASGKTFEVISIEHKNAGATIVVYGDGVSTYTAKAIFEMKDAKNLNLVEFSIFDPATSSASSSTPVVADEAQGWVLDYLKEHISELSPEKEVLGGKFYITKITFENSGNAVVEYEDGHIALKAHVNFILDGGKNVEVLKWDMLSTK